MNVDPEVHAGEDAPRYSRLLVRRGAPRLHGRRRHELSPSHRPRGHLGPGAWSSGSSRAAGPGGERARRPAGPRPRSSTSPAIRAGAASRSATARTPTSSRAWAWRRYSASRVGRTDDRPAARRRDPQAFRRARPVRGRPQHRAAQASGTGNSGATHLYPFEMAVKVAHAHSLMASYNEWDGVPNHVNHKLLTEILRTEWGFDGYVMSDGGGIDVALREPRRRRRARARPAS